MFKRILLLFIILILTLPVSPVFAQDQNSQPIYIVQQGDTLNSIAERFGVTSQDLINANNLSNPNILPVGAQLIIPGYEGISGILTTQSVPLGETLFSIGLQQRIPLDVIERLNRITSPAEVYTGSYLIIPVDDKVKPYNSSVVIPENNTYMELTAANQINPWTLVQNSQASSPWQLLPGDVSFYQTEGEGKLASSISPQITKLDISPLPLVQGDTIVITLDTKQPVTLTGSLNNTTLNFFPLDTNKYIALAGIYAMATPGLAPFTLSGKFDDGATFDFSQMVLLKAGQFIKDPPLQVDPITIDPAYTKPEDDLVKKNTSVASPTKMWTGQFMLPVDEPACIKSYYGDRRSYNGGPYIYFHTGLDFGVCSNLNIKTIAPGIVVYTGKLTVRGNTTIIDHGWGIYSCYYHQNKINVNVGDHIETGQVIGEIGDTGRVTGPHLHLDLWVNGIQVDPTSWLFDNRSYP
jgi:murein DD-endopeptidase MepM/ murein hydrolase activator NlpD